MRAITNRYPPRRIAGGLILGCAVLLGGCIPGPMGKYYKPQMQAGTEQHYTGTACHGQAGPPGMLHVTLASGVAIHIDAIRRRMPTPPFGVVPNQGRPLHIVLDIPRGVTVRFENTTARVSEDGGHSWQDIPFNARVVADVAVPRRVDMAAMAPTRVTDMVPNSFHAQATLNFSLPKYVPESFAMTIPAIRVAGGPTLPETRFDARAQARPESYKGEYRNHRSLIYTTPESRALLERRFAECQAEVKAGATGLHCKNIRLYDVGGFKRDVGPFSMSGRWYVFNVESGSPFNGELRIEYKRPLDWQFAADALQLRDERGEIHRIPLRALTLYFSYGVPLDAAVRGVNDAKYSGDTTLTLDANLGDKESRSYRVQLPPLLIDGKTYRLPPIELIKHIFEFGLWPFNC